jgi:hypothetical protein
VLGWPCTGKRVACDSGASRIAATAAAVLRAVSSPSLGPPVSTDRSRSTTQRTATQGQTGKPNTQPSTESRQVHTFSSLILFRPTYIRWRCPYLESVAHASAHQRAQRLRRRG